MLKAKSPLWGLSMRFSDGFLDGLILVLQSSLSSVDKWHVISSAVWSWLLLRDRVIPGDGGKR